MLPADFFFDVRRQLFHDTDGDFVEINHLLEELRLPLDLEGKNIRQVAFELLPSDKPFHLISKEFPQVIYTSGFLSLALNPEEEPVHLIPWEGYFHITSLELSLDDETCIPLSFWIGYMRNLTSLTLGKPSNGRVRFNFRRFVTRWTTPMNLQQLVLKFPQATIEGGALFTCLRQLKKTLFALYLECDLIWRRDQTMLPILQTSNLQTVTFNNFRLQAGKDVIWTLSLFEKAPMHTIEFSTDLFTPRGMAKMWFERICALRRLEKLKQLAVINLQSREGVNWDIDLEQRFDGEVMSALYELEQGGVQFFAV
ncbi:hypothetical protein BT69DRAFT_1353122 [Atractiella rhizophila]|nr:hypothetical protein BT69DRAFT_1353122 [Atractiella rhizophila]